MIDIKKLKLKQVKTAADNPRSITQDKFQKLIDSILVFPKMMEIRPVVVDRRKEALGGNMRLRALREIAKMSADGVASRLAGNADFVKKPEGEKDTLLDWWCEWLTDPDVPTVDASHLSEDERRQFMIKDNVSSGSWDFDELANKWDNKQLGDWGMDVWQTPEYNFPDPEQPQPEEPEDPLAGMEDALPPELQGVDLAPRGLPKSGEESQTVCDYISISYHPDEKSALAAYLGIPEDILYRNVCWRIDDLKAAMAEAKPKEGADDDE